MSEWELVFLIPLRLSIIVIFVILYAVGGRSGSKKWFRRYLGGSLLGLGLIGLSLLTGSFRWPLLALPGIYIGALVMGYGGETTIMKFFRRLLYGLVFGLGAIWIALWTGHWFLGWLQFIIATFASPFFGLTNKEPAVHEEAMIALSSTVFTVFMV